MAKSHKIKSIIKSTEKTAKITKAMQVVSASKLPNALNRYQNNKPFSDLAYQIIEHYTELGTHPYFKPRAEVKSVGLLIITTDRGLCGNLNLQLFKQVLEQLNTYREQGVKTQISVIGQKGIQFFSGNHSLLASCSRLSDKPELSDIMPAILPLLTAYDNKEIDAIYVASNTFVNTLTQRAEIKPLLPLPLPESAQKFPPDYQYEPSIDDVINKLITNYTESIIYRSVIENIACEQAARMIAMKNATENANDIIEDLNLTYNKIRQAMITQEIAEISAGANQSDGENL